MSTNLLAVIILTLTAAVVVAIFLVLWRERTSARESRIAVVGGMVLAGWAISLWQLLGGPWVPHPAASTGRSR